MNYQSQLTAHRKQTSTSLTSHVSFTSSTSVYQQTDSIPSREYIHLSMLLLRTLAVLSEDHPDFS